MHVFKPPTSFEELMAVQHFAAINVTGAHHSSYNGTHKELPYTMVDGEQVLGIADWDRTVRYDEEHVRAPLRKMFLNRGVPGQSPRDLLRYRNAVLVVFHENLHFLAAEGTEHDDAKDMFQYPEVRALEEGATEEYGYDTVDDYILALQLHKVAPGIETVPGTTTYPRFTPAAGQLAWDLGGLTGPRQRVGLGKQEVLRRMNIVHASGKWAFVTGTLIRAYGLDERLRSDPHALAHAEYQIQQAMWNKFRPLATLTYAPGNTVVSQSSAAGRAAFTAGIETAGKLWTTSLSHGGVSPLTPRSYDPGTARDIPPYTPTRQQHEPER